MNKLIVKKLDILDEETGWENTSQSRLDFSINSYEFSSPEMYKFFYGFYSFQCSGTAIFIESPFVYNKIEHLGKCRISNMNYHSDISCVWKGKVYYGLDNQIKPIFNTCSLKTHTAKLTTLNDFKNIQKCKKREKAEEKITTIVIENKEKKVEKVMKIKKNTAPASGIRINAERKCKKGTKIKKYA